MPHTVYAILEGMTTFLFHRVLPAATTVLGVLLITLAACIAWDCIYGHHKDERND